MPSDFRTFANRPTSRWSSRYVRTRWSPGSPSQTSAALLRRGPSRCRSRQLTEMLSFPPTNHFAFGGFQSRTFFHGLNHESSRANPAQDFSESRAALAEVALAATVARRANAFGGRKDRFSFS